MHLSLRAATVLLPLLLHGAQSAAEEQLRGRHLRRNKNKSSPSLSLEESDTVSTPEIWFVMYQQVQDMHLANYLNLFNVHLFLLQHTDHITRQ